MERVYEWDGVHSKTMVMYILVAPSRLDCEPAFLLFHNLPPPNLYITLSSNLEGCLMAGESPIFHHPHLTTPRETPEPTVAHSSAQP